MQFAPLRGQPSPTTTNMVAKGSGFITSQTTFDSLENGFPVIMHFWAEPKHVCKSSRELPTSVTRRIYIRVHFGKFYLGILKTV